MSLHHLTCQVAAASSLELQEPLHALPETKGSGEEPVWLAWSVLWCGAGYVAHGFYPGQAASHQSTPGCPVTAPSAPLRHRHHADQGDLRAPLLSVIGGLASGGSVDKNARVAAEGVQTASCGQATIDRLLPSNFSLPSSCPDGAKERGAA